MKTIFFFILSFFALNFCFASQDYFVSAPNGLLIRKFPSDSARVIGKFEFGTRIKKIKNTDKSYSIMETGKTINGVWTWVEVTPVSNASISLPSRIIKGYVFSGFLKKESDFVSLLTEQMKNEIDIEKYKINVQNSVFCLQGDFFGDGISDRVLLLEDLEKNKRIAFLNHKENNTSEVIFLENKNTSFDMKSYNWVGEFLKVESQETLWSNYEDGFRAFEEVPKKERVKLEYDAIYVHALESCGGGFIFWKDGKFHWLQQE
ncbi:hypothetical protein [Bernardetia sp.]|uniref:hypothetical protein n=1 Tax=Bernardetia sp. TaxID=1937974 RepID=UPI0025BCBF56|nr:hypothetical protein [Bernardetia sp.]